MKQVYAKKVEPETPNPYFVSDDKKHRKIYNFIVEFECHGKEGSRVARLSL